MKRRSLLLLGALTPFGLFVSRFLGARVFRAPSPTDFREQAQQLNELASSIHTPEDARRLVDFVAGLFAKETPYGWSGRSLRSRIAQAEFSAVADPQKLIPEARLAKAWNRYVETIQAPEDQKVIPVEVHNLRDEFLATSRYFWNSGSRNIWNVPSIYATLPDGGIAPGCRAIESIRLLWDLANMPDNLKGARERVSKGQLVSDLIPKSPQAPVSLVVHGHVETRATSRPIKIAEENYIKLQGEKAFSHAVMAMLDDTIA